MVSTRSVRLNKRVDELNILKISKLKKMCIRDSAIVNAANTSLLGGGGVDGAIHRKAGVELLRECETLNGCKTGEAKITGAYKLTAKYIIHTVGPIYRGGKNNEKELLENAYKNSLRLAVSYDIKTIAFPSISTGVYSYPVKEASLTAVKTILDFLNKNTSIEEVRMVCFDINTYNTCLLYTSFLLASSKCLFVFSSRPVVAQTRAVFLSTQKSINLSTRVK